VVRTTSSSAWLAAWRASHSFASVRASPGPGVRVIGEFFVLRCHRRRGVGTRAARMLFARFPGRWEVAELSWNVAAQRFWRPLIRRCAVDGVIERRRRHGDLVFVVQHFETAKWEP
jgi:predicted acetyltransferase